MFVLRFSRLSLTEMMEAYPVSTLVNSPANDSQECAELFRDSLF